MIAVNGFVYTGLTVFDADVLRELNVRVGALKLRDTITIFTFGAVILGSGYLIDRYPVRPVICTGLVMLAVGLFAYGRVTELWHVYALHVLLGVGQATSGIVSQVVLVSRWTSKYRNLAIGLVVAGSSVGNAIVPALNAWLLELGTWRQAMAIGSIVPATMAVVSWLVIRERAPRDELLGDAGPSTVTFKAALRSRNFWLLAAVAATTVYAVNGLSTNVVLYVGRELGLAVAIAAQALLMLFLVSIVGQILAGSLSQRANPVHIHAASVLLMTLGVVMLAGSGGSLLFASMFVFGLGWGGNSACLVILPSVLFDPRYLGKVLAAIAVAETFFGGLGPTVTGYLYERLGSYEPAFFGIAGLTALAFILCPLIRSK